MAKARRGSGRGYGNLLPLREAALYVYEIHYTLQTLKGIYLQRSRRIWLLDRQAYALNLEMRDGLGAWIQRRLRKGISKQGEIAAAELVACRVPVAELRRQWELQQEAQLSVRARKSSIFPSVLVILLIIIMCNRCSGTSEERARQSTEPPG